MRKTNLPALFLVWISILVLILHLLILLKVIPWTIAWGGRLSTEREMYVFETVSVVVTLFFLWVVLQKGNWVNRIMGEKVLTVFLWVFFGIFVLNSIGNILAVSVFEKCMTVITLANAVLIWRVNRS